MLLEPPEGERSCNTNAAAGTVLPSNTLPCPEGCRTVLTSSMRSGLQSRWDRPSLHFSQIPMSCWDLLFGRASDIRGTLIIRGELLIRVAQEERHQHPTSFLSAAPARAASLSSPRSKRSVRLLEGSLENPQQHRSHTAHKPHEEAPTTDSSPPAGNWSYYLL